MKNNKGITLMALVITIIILIILSTIVIYSAKGAIAYAKYNKAKAEIEIVQKTVDSWHKEYDTASDEQLNNYGEEVQEENNYGEDVPDEIKNNAESLTGGYLPNTFEDENYKYLSETYLKEKLGLNSSYEFLVNIETRNVILLGGLSYNENTYFTSEDFGLLVVEDIKPVDSISFELEQNEDKIIISDLSFEDGNGEKVHISKFIVEYSNEEPESGTDEEVNWINVTEKLYSVQEDGKTKYGFSVDEGKKYYVRICTTDKKVISNFESREEQE